MKGLISNFRRGKRNQRTNQFIILADSIKNRKDAAKFIGKKVEWKSSAGKIISGEVRSAHGNKGALRVLFEKGLPGQAIATEVEIV